MRNLIFGFLILGLGIQPVGAMTQPDDNVGVVFIDVSGPDQAQYPEKRYVKKWKDIKLSAQNIKLLTDYVHKLDNANEKYRVGAIWVAVRDNSQDRLQAAAFYGDYGNVMMKRFGDSYVCSLSLTGQGGFAGIQERPCGKE